MKRLLASATVMGCLLLGLVWACCCGHAPQVAQAAPEETAQPDRSPVDLVITADNRWLITANETANTISLVDLSSGVVVAEAACGEKPAQVALTPDGRRVLVTTIDGGELRVFDLGDGQITPAGAARLGFEPRGVAVAPDGKRAYVALTAAHVVAVVDLATLAVTSRIEVDQWPSYLDVTPDGRRLAVGCSGSRSVSVVDTQTQETLFSESFDGINSGHLRVSADGDFVYLPFMVYRHNPITARNIRLGWVLATRIGRIKLAGPARRQAISLDPPGKAVSDPHGLALTRDEQWMVCTGSGTHELLVYKLPGLPFQDYGGPGDHIDRDLARDRERFYRIDLGGRPMGVRFGGDQRRAFVANYLLNCVQEVDLDERRVVRTIDLGGPPAPSLARRGEAIFYDGRRSLDQWYSCHSCHYDGGGNAVTMDTRNDGSEYTFKTAPNLYNVTKTPPWTWHGWQRDLRDAMHKSMTVTMLGPKPSDEDVEALLAWLEKIQPPPNPYRLPDGSLNAAAQRGKRVFESEQAGCANCHSGLYFTDGQIHDVGLGSDRDAYDGFNTPSLLYAHKKVRYLHNGRAKSLEEVLTKYHKPAEVSGKGELSEGELADLIEYVKSL